MSNDLLVQCCAPTLAGLKTGSLFSCPCPDRGELTAQIRELNRQLRERGLMILPLRYSQKRALVYLFRPLALQRDLKNSTARAILDGAGYGGLSSGQCLLRIDALAIQSVHHLASLSGNGHLFQLPLAQCVARRLRRKELSAEYYRQV
jgi:hypothetical protein